MNIELATFLTTFLTGFVATFIALFLWDNRQFVVDIVKLLASIRRVRRSGRQAMYYRAKLQEFIDAATERGKAGYPECVHGCINKDECCGDGDPSGCLANAYSTLQMWDGITADMKEPHQ